MRKVYIVFAYDQYYPTGPDDIVGVYLTQEAAHARMEEMLKLKYQLDDGGEYWDYIECHEFTVLDSDEGYV